MFNLIAEKGKYHIRRGGGQDILHLTLTFDLKNILVSKKKKKCIPSSQTSVSILIAFKLLLWRGLQFNFALFVTSLVRRIPSSSSIISDEDSESELFFRC